MIRKLTLFGFFLLLVGVSPAQAQLDIKPGVRAGVNLANIRGDDAPSEAESQTGFHAGVILLIDPVGPLAFQPEVLYTQKGFETSDSGGILSFTANYIQVNALAKLQIPVTGPVSPHISVGPAVGIKASESNEFSGGGGNVSVDGDSFSDSEVSAVFDAGIDIAAGFGTVMVGLRYDLGLTNAVDDDSDPSVKTGTFGITAGLLF